MSRRVNESARVLNYFKLADLGKAEVLYDLVREVMQERLAPAKAARKAQAKKRVPKVDGSSVRRLTPAEQQADAEAYERANPSND